jgi:hypothetical protein
VLDQFAQLGELGAEFPLEVRGEVFRLAGKNELHEHLSFKL